MLLSADIEIYQLYETDRKRIKNLVSDSAISQPTQDYLTGRTLCMCHTDINTRTYIYYDLSNLA